MGLDAHGPKTFWPDDTETEFYIKYVHDIGYLYRLAQAKWPGIRMNEVDIEAESVQTSNIGWDQATFLDYTEFLHITASKFFDRMKREKGEKTG